MQITAAEPNAVALIAFLVAGVITVKLRCFPPLDRRVVEVWLWVGGSFGSAALIVRMSAPQSSLLAALCWSAFIWASATMWFEFVHMKKNPITGKFSFLPFT
jgi:hypothetical protein